jgi:hypothetical protein
MGALLRGDLGRPPASLSFNQAVYALLIEGIDPVVQTAQGDAVLSGHLLGRNVQSQGLYAHQTIMAPLGRSGFGGHFQFR